MRPAKTSILYFLSDVGTSVVGFLATFYFARELGAGPLGQYFLVIALLAWLTIPTNGLASAVNKRVSEGRSADAVFSAAGTLSVAYGIVVSVAVVLASQFVDAYVGAPVSALFVVLFLANVAFTLTTGGLNGQKRVATSGFLRMGERVLRVLGQVALIVGGYEVVGLVVGHGLALIVAALVGVVLYGFDPRLPDRETIRSVFEYGRYSWLGNMKSKTFGWMDTLVLGLFVSSGLVGVYQISWQLASILILVSNAIENALFPEISDVASSGDRTEVRKLLSEALFYAGIFVIPGFFGVLVVGPQVLRIYGPEFVQGAPLLLVLIFARAVNVYEMQFLNAINGVDRPDVAFRINAVFIATNVFLNVVLVYEYGWYGAAVATAISSLVMFALSYRAIVALVGPPDLPLAGVGQQILTGIVMAAVLTVTQRTLPIQNMYVTVALVAFGATVYGMVLFGLSTRFRTKLRSLASV